ncbi:CoA-binding protein [Jannaschia marina]|uniref:CoA-binding protein n=1 Tax=Jannaschia marina TaxID=2741674 RepID=UPI0015CDD665|nr:CoA-binding protein [Jannaschia marina]
MTVAPSDTLLRQVLIGARSFACVGLSPDPVRPSNFVGRYLSRRGYTVIPVHPAHIGTELFGEPFVGSVAEIGRPVDVLDVFRRPDAVPGIVEEGLAALSGLKCVWLQLGLRSPEAERLCAAAGVILIQDRCPKIEHQRLFGELRRGGFNTGVISSRL